MIIYFLLKRNTKRYINEITFYETIIIILKKIFFNVEILYIYDKSKMNIN